MDFVILDNLPFDVVIGRPTIARLELVLDFQKSELRFAVGGKKTALAMIPVHERSKNRGGDTHSEDFTSSSS